MKTVFALDLIPHLIIVLINIVIFVGVHVFIFRQIFNRKDDKSEKTTSKDGHLIEKSNMVLDERESHQQVDNNDEDKRGKCNEKDREYNEDVNVELYFITSEANSVRKMTIDHFNNDKCKHHSVKYVIVRKIINCEIKTGVNNRR
jgi:hypothetical protein